MSKEGIPEFLQRKEAAKAATPMSDTNEAPATPTKPPKAAADKPKAKAAPKATAKPAKAASERPKGKQLPVDAFGFHEGSLKSKAAGMYADKAGATVAEVKEKTGSLQLNLLKQLEKGGCKVKRTKENGPTGRSVTRYHLSK